MRKNWLASTWKHWFRPRPVVPDVAFQGDSEPYPGHWRQFPEPWRDLDGDQAERGARAVEMTAAFESAVADLPELWRRVVMARAVAEGDDRQVAERFGLTLQQERDILARARAVVRDQLEDARNGGAA